jgi:hypothetical protein
MATFFGGVVAVEPADEEETSMGGTTSWGGGICPVAGSTILEMGFV